MCPPCSKNVSLVCLKVEWSEVGLCSFNETHLWNAANVRQSRTSMFCSNNFAIGVLRGVNLQVSMWLHVHGNNRSGVSTHTAAVHSGKCSPAVKGTWARYDFPECTAAVNGPKLSSCSTCSRVVTRKLTNVTWKSIKNKIYFLNLKRFELKKIVVCLFFVQRGSVQSPWNCGCVALSTAWRSVVKVLHSFKHFRVTARPLPCLFAVFEWCWVRSDIEVAFELHPHMKRMQLYPHIKQWKKHWKYEKYIYYVSKFYFLSPSCFFLMKIAWKG